MSPFSQFFIHFTKLAQYNQIICVVFFSITQCFMRLTYMQAAKESRYDKEAVMKFFRMVRFLIVSSVSL